MKVNTQHEPLEPLPIEVKKLYGLYFTVREIFQKAINFSLEQQQNAENQSACYLSKLVDQTADELGNLRYNEAKARSFYYIQMYNYLNFNAEKTQDSQKNCDPWVTPLRAVLPELNKTSITAYMLAHQDLFQKLSYSQTTPFNEESIVSDNLPNLETKSRALYHHQMFHALKIELSKLDFIEVYQKTQSTSSSCMDQIQTDVKTILDRIKPASKEQLIKNYIKELSESKTKTSHDYQILYAFQFELSKLQFDQVYERSKLISELSAKLPLVTNTSSSPAPAAVQASPLTSQD